GGILTDCLKNVADGDTLFIVAHGREKGAKFVWGGAAYPGFGFGAGYAMPDGFDKLKNVNVTLATCWSANDPDGKGPDTSLVDKMVKAMGGAGNKNTVTGFNDLAQSECVPSFTGQKAAIDAAIECYKKDSSWMNNPPANRPGTGGNGQPANQ